LILIFLLLFLFLLWYTFTWFDLIPWNMIQEWWNDWVPNWKMIEWRNRVSGNSRLWIIWDEWSEFDWCCHCRENSTFDKLTTSLSFNFCLMIWWWTMASLQLKYWNIGTGKYWNIETLLNSRIEKIDVSRTQEWNSLLGMEFKMQRLSDRWSQWIAKCALLSNAHIVGRLWKVDLPLGGYGCQSFHFRILHREVK
jgi:hypothetical protein